MSENIRTVIRDNFSDAPVIRKLQQTEKTDSVLLADKEISALVSSVSTLNKSLEGAVKMTQSSPL